MPEKRNKYESLFIFSSEDVLMKHLETCEDCRAEHEKMEKTANLVKEAKPHYLVSSKNRFNKNLIGIAAGLTVLFLAYFSLSSTNFTGEISENDLSYGERESIVLEMGLPIDEYGLFMVY